MPLKGARKVLMRLRKKRTAVGLDIGSHAVKIVELAERGDHVQLLRWGRAELIPDAIVDGEIIDRGHVVETLRELIAESGITNRRVTVSVSGRGVIVKRITVEKGATEEADEAIRRSSEQHVPFDIGEVVMDYQILSEDAEGGRLQVLLVVAQRDVVLSRVEIVRDAGLIPVAVDVDAFAVQNALVWGEPYDPEESVAIVNVGAERSNIHAVRAGEPLYTQDLATGTRSLLDSVRRSCDVSQDTASCALLGEDERDVDALSGFVGSFTDDLRLAVDRVGLFLKTSGSADHVNRIVMTGGGSWVPGLLPGLEAKTSVPVEAGDPLRQLQVPEDQVEILQPRSSEFAVAVGLALRGAVDS